MSHRAHSPHSDGENEHDHSDGESAVAEHANVNGKRKRPMSVSCELCKQRKVKCDRGQPSCGWCKRNGALCEYRERKKPGLRAGYGRELEQRLDRLEEILQSHSRILEQTFSNGGQSSHSDQISPHERDFFAQNAGHDGRVSREEAASFNQKPQISQNMDYGPQTPSMQSIHGDVYQQQQLHLDQMQPQQSEPPQQSPDFYNNNNRLESSSIHLHHSQTDFSDLALPPYDLLYKLVGLYFTHINTWCPILHRRSTLDALFGPSSLVEEDRIILHAIVATTLRFSADERLTAERRRHYHDISKQKVLLYGLETSSVKALQALVILALDLVGSSNGPPGWNLLALITRSVVQLGLSVETTSSSIAPNYPSIYTLRAMILPDPKNWIEDESRRRLFWMVYLLDRYATIATAFEFALDEKELDRTLPCRDDLWSKNTAVETRWFRTAERTEYDVDKPENLGAFSYYVEILGILSRIHRFLKKPVDISALSDVEQWQGEYKELDNALTSWKSGLPSEYGNMAKIFQPGGNRSISCAWIMLHATYHTTVIRLHSSAAYPTTRSLIFTPSYSASQRCHSAVDNIAALGEYVVNIGMLPKLGPPFAFTLWVAARLLLVHGSTIDHKLSPQLQFFVDTLSEMGRYWAVAERYTSILQRVLDEYHDSERAVAAPTNDRGGGPAAAAAAAKAERVTPSTVKILADMRRCAYDLDFLISRQPRLPARMPNVLNTPAKTPAPNELEYLDVFDFFNFPRLPVPPGGDVGSGNANGTSGDGVNAALSVGNGGNNHGLMSEGRSSAVVGSNEFNITNFMVDANADWLFKNHQD